MTMCARKYRMVPSDRAGYGPGLWVLQYHDRDMRAWFDMSDPQTKDVIEERLRAARREA